MGCKRSMILYWDYIHITIINHPYLHISYIIKYKPIKNNKKHPIYHYISYMGLYPYNYYNYIS